MSRSFSTVLATTAVAGLLGAGTASAAPDHSWAPAAITRQAEPSPLGVLDNAPVISGVVNDLKGSDL
ncbi:hypothetical protein [Streptomyces alanosinicus]|nr:hypothetical protein [Streptomyces alanosinicus]